MNPNERSSHPSRAQIEALLEYLERHPGLAKGFSKVASARDVARKHWERLAFQLNSMGGSVKSWKQWTKYWADKKSAVKKKAALRAAASRRTGGGVEEVVVEITEVEERIIFLMGGESFAIGDRHLAIEPFSEPQQNDPSSASAPVRLEEVEIEIASVSTEALPSFGSPPRTPPISPVEQANRQSTPSRQGLYPNRTSPAPSQLPPRHTSPRRRPRRTLRPTSPPSQRRSQFTSTTDRFLRLEEQRLELERQNTEILAAVTSAIQSQFNQLSEANRAMAAALNAIAESLRLLAERR